MAVAGLACYPCRALEDKGPLRLGQGFLGVFTLPYGKMLQLGEDFKAYYIFRDQYGGYMIPKAALGGREEEFSRFVQEKTGKLFIRRWTPLRRLKSWLKQRENEPEHL